MKTQNDGNQDYERMSKVLTYLDAHQMDHPSLDELSNVVGLSPFHFQRTFKRWAGVTPKQFQSVLSLNHAKAILRESQSSVLDASLDVGLSSSSRLHDLFVTVDSVTPGEYKKMGHGLQVTYGFHESPFGDCLIAGTDRGLCFLGFVRESRSDILTELGLDWPLAELVEDSCKTGQFCKSIFQPSNERTELPLFVKGTSFQVKVWMGLLRLPEHSLISYEGLAESIKEPKAVRAAASAVAHNSISYVIPCHRIIRKMGILGQYRWGANRKRLMVAWEQCRKLS